MERLFDKLSLPAGRLREKKRSHFSSAKLNILPQLNRRLPFFFRKTGLREQDRTSEKTEWVEEKTRSDLAKTKSDLVPTICDGAIFRTSV